MKKVLLVLVGVLLASCTDDKCTQTVIASKVGRTSQVTICHSGTTLNVNSNAVQVHLDHGDTLGECTTLSIAGFIYEEGEVQEIGCQYDLPFIHTNNKTGEQWIFEAY